MFNSAAEDFQKISDTDSFQSPDLKVCNEQSAMAVQELGVTIVTLNAIVR
jgi:hypothetical protein